MSSVSVLIFLLAGNCLTIYWLLKLSILVWPSKLLLALASIVILGSESTKCPAWTHERRVVAKKKKKNWYVQKDTCVGFHSKSIHFAQKKISGAVTRVFRGNHGNRTRERHKNDCEPKNLKTLTFGKNKNYSSNCGVHFSRGHPNIQTRQTRRL